MVWTRAVLTLSCLDTLTTVRKTDLIAEAIVFVFHLFASEQQRLRGIADTLLLSH
jgi:hypothetical protein